LSKISSHRNSLYPEELTNEKFTSYLVSIGVAESNWDQALHHPTILDKNIFNPPSLKKKKVSKLDLTDDKISIIERHSKLFSDQASIKRSLSLTKNTLYLKEESRLKNNLPLHRKESNTSDSTEYAISSHTLRSQSSDTCVPSPNGTLHASKDFLLPFEKDPIYGSLSRSSMKTSLSRSAFSLDRPNNSEFQLQRKLSNSSFGKLNKDDTSQSLGRPSRFTVTKQNTSPRPKRVFTVEKCSLNNGRTEIEVMNKEVKKLEEVEEKSLEDLEKFNYFTFPQGKKNLADEEDFFKTNSLVFVDREEEEDVDEKLLEVSNNNNNNRNSQIVLGKKKRLSRIIKFDLKSIKSDKSNEYPENGIKPISNNLSMEKKLDLENNVEMNQFSITSLNNLKKKELNFGLILGSTITSRTSGRNFKVERINSGIEVEKGRFTIKKKKDL
ncbi:hypothetical protein HK099_002353, partial [Clydaea vesicula]